MVKTTTVMGMPPTYLLKEDRGALPLIFEETPRVSLILHSRPRGPTRKVEKSIHVRTAQSRSNLVLEDSFESTYEASDDNRRMILKVLSDDTLIKGLERRDN